MRAGFVTRVMFSKPSMTIIERSDVKKSRRELATKICAPKSESGPSRAWVILGSILIAAAIYWAIDYQPYILPNSDFFRIKDMAAVMAVGEIPEDFKQMPLVPAMMVPLAAILPVTEDAYLHAISVLNIGLSVGSLLLLYLIAREFLGGTLALIPVLVLLAAPQFTISAHQPMLEPSIGFFSLATLVALARRSSWAYALAGLCALSRYELAIMLPVVFVVETLRTPREWLAIGIKCTLAGVPFLIWFGLSIFIPDEGNPYFGEMVRAAPWTVAKNMQTTFPSGMYLFGFMIMGWSLGLYHAIRRNLPLAAGIFTFFFLYTAAHFIYGRPLGRYSYTVQWVLPLFATIGFHAVFVTVRPYVAKLDVRSCVVFGVVLATVALFLILRGIRFVSLGFPTAAVHSEAWYLGWSFALLVCAGAVVFLSIDDMRIRQRWLGGLLAVVLLTIPLLHSGRSLATVSTAIFYEKSDMVLVSEWLARHIGPDQRVVMARHHELRDGMPNIGLDQSVAFGSFAAETLEDFIQELDQKGIEYVVFTYRPKYPESKQHPLYYRNLQNYLSGKIYLMDPFREGEEVQGFEKVATIPPAHPAQGHPAHIYRRSVMSVEPEVKYRD